MLTREVLTARHAEAQRMLQERRQQRARLVELLEAATADVHVAEGRIAELTVLLEQEAMPSGDQ